MLEKYEDQDFLLEITDGICYVSYKKDCVVTKDVSEKSIIERIRISNGKSLPVLLDTRNVKYWTMDSRNNSMKGHAYHLIEYTAIVFKSATFKIIWDFTVRLFPTPITHKSFLDFEEAKSWLIEDANKKES